MTLIGIDFSINSPGMCILRNNDYNFFGGYRENKKLRKKEQLFFNKAISNEIPKFEIFKIPELVVEENYFQQEIINLKDAANLAKLVVNIIDNLNIDKKASIIGIEGFSYNSQGAFVSKMYGYGYILRYILYERGYNFKIVSPTSVKKTAGKGSFKKEQMIEAFLNNNLNDNILNLNNLYNQIINNIEIFKDNKTFYKPLEDVIDAYWILKSL